jgi:uncharacterized protein (DUF1697 family)
VFQSYAEWMPRYVAFLRAINVGGRTVRMDALRRAFEGWGARGVETFIASGNIVFETPRRNAASLERAIEAHLLEAIGFSVTTFVRTVPELAEIAAHQPFPKAQLSPESRVFVGFMKKAPPPAAVATLRTDLDDFAVRNRELYWLRRNQLMQSIASGPNAEKVLATPITVRNVNTVQRLAAKYCAGFLHPGLTPPGTNRE